MDTSYRTVDLVAVLGDKLRASCFSIFELFIVVFQLPIGSRQNKSKTSIRLPCVDLLTVYGRLVEGGGGGPCPPSDPGGAFRGGAR